MTKSIYILLCCLALVLHAQAVTDAFAGSSKNSLHANNKSKSRPSDGFERVALHTPYGRIILKLLSDNAPQAVAAIKQHAETNACKSCNFYRAEARPPADRPEGPPYGLLQGNIDLPTTPALEGSLPVKAGHVAFIPNTSDFFIALVDHPEWNTSHTVFAEIEDFVSTDLIAIQWVHEVTHPDYGTVMRMMNDAVPFTISTQLIDPFGY